MAHASALIAIVVGLMVLGPLIVWLMKKDTSEFVAHHARESLNFQITMLIVGVILIVAGWFTCGIAWALLAVVWLGNVILSIIGAVKANEGQRWSYPFSIRLVT